VHGRDSRCTYRVTQATWPAVVAMGFINVRGQWGGVIRSGSATQYTWPELFLRGLSTYVAGGSLFLRVNQLTSSGIVSTVYSTCMTWDGIRARMT
jgi:hypothetical protein